MNFFSTVEDNLFWFFNMYLRNSVFDTVLPFCESSLPVLLVALVSVVVFAVYCKKTYGETVYRTLLFIGMLGLSAGFAHEGSKIFSFERARPYQEIAGTMFYNTKEDLWLQSQYPRSEAYSPVVQEEAAENNTMQQAETAAAGSQAAEQNKEAVQNSSAVPNEQVDNPLNINPNHIPVRLIDGSVKLHPSSVMSISMAIALVIALLVAKASPYIYLFPVIIGWAQIYTGSAYLTDILVGWCVGLVSVFLAWLCFAFLFKFTGRYF